MLTGAVDPVEFRPAVFRSHPLTPNRWVIGGLANKNPAPLVEALSGLPSEVVLRLFGYDRYNLAQTCADLIAAGRLELTGVLEGKKLSRFYREVDCVVMTEEFGGWANLAAESMASGTPLVCTPHATAAFARHDETALVVDEPTSAAISHNVHRLLKSPALCQRLSEAGRETISDFSWDSYARKLLTLIRRDGRIHYTCAPELGLYGKWPLEDRLQGLQPLLQQTKGLSIIDFGAGEGVVAREFLKHGAKLLHGFELNAQRVDFANALLAQWHGAKLRCADLSSWEDFWRSHSDLIAREYDIVLYLGIQHHLPPKHRLETLEAAIGLAKRFFAIRTTKAVYETDHIEQLLETAGFHRQSLKTDASPGGLGVARIFEKCQDNK